MTRNRILWTMLLVLFPAVLLTWHYWPETSSQKVRRLLLRFDRLPQGRFNLTFSFDSSNSIYAEWNRLGPEDVPALVEALDDPQCPMSHLAAERLAKIGDSHAVPGLIRALNKEDHGFIVRMRAAHALGELRDSRAVEPLIECLEDDESCVRRTAAEAIGKCGDGRGVEPLIRSLYDEDWNTRIEAMTALGLLGDGELLIPSGKGSKKKAPLQSAKPGRRHFASSEATDARRRHRRGEEECGAGDPGRW